VNFETSEKYKDDLRGSFLFEGEDISPFFVFCRFPHLEDINDSWALLKLNSSYLIRHGIWRKFSSPDKVDYIDYTISEDEFLELHAGFDDMVLLDDQSKLGIYDGAWYELQFYDNNLVEARYEKWGNDKTFIHMQSLFPSRLRDNLGFNRCGQIFQG